MKLKKFINLVESIAPPELAENWDNTGLLIEPLQSKEISTVLLCIDCTEAVAREAVRKKADAVIAYHPLFFGGLKSLTKTSPQARAAIRMIQSNIAVYSPHTALDAAPGGVNDWLADSLGEGDLYCAPEGGARIVELTKPVKLPTVAQRMKKALRISSAKSAAANNRAVKTIAVCAGAGIEALRDIKADCYLTGEMKHHDVLACVENGTSVILCGHTETERGYLSILKSRLSSESEETLNILISTTDRAPLAST
jgi:dinuclear metal center YbgI/SA1388 family protein